ncbi:MAG: YihY/virulence factor BrkB family protein [Clostridia bacterium]|nr:YihY/virulence factor BrkB family protein [Clostridia bacterium]
MEKLKNTALKIIKFLDCLTGDFVSIYAAQASFFLVISSIPFIMLCFTIIKSFINIDLQMIIHTINAFAPPQISQLLTMILNELFDKASSASVISVTAVSALWLSSRGVLALYMGINTVYHVPMRNYFYSRVISIIYTLAFIAALIMTIIVFGFGNKIEIFLGAHSIVLSAIVNLFLKVKIIVFMVYLTIIFALFYKFLPKKNNSFKSQLPGAAFSAVGWMVFSYVYSIYIENFSNYSYVYGSLAALVFLMLWLYFCMNIFLYGAQLNKMIANGFFSKKTTL